MYFCLLYGFALVWKVLSIDEYNIVRKDKDQFKFPSPSVCILNNTCREMGASAVPDADGCPCRCEERRSTFGYFNGTWKCENNVVIRKHSECTITIFKTDGSRDSSSPIIAVPSSVSSVSFGHEIGTLNIPILNQRSVCQLEDTWYLACNGIWTQISSLKKSFSILKLSDKQHLTIKSGHSFSSYHPSMIGQLIKVLFSCTSPPTPTDCVTLKVEGETHCPVSVSPSMYPSQQSNTTQSTTTETKTATSNRSETPSSALPTKAINLSLPTTTKIVSDFSSSSRVFSTSTTVGRLTVVLKSTKRTVKKEEQNTKETNQVALIAGAAGGAVALILILVIAFVVRSKRKRDTRPRSPSRRDILKPDFENSVYDKGADTSFKFTVSGKPNIGNTHTYDYTDNLPFQIETVANTKGINTPMVVNRLYDQTEDLKSDFPPDPEAIYNVLEESDHEDKLSSVAKPLQSISKDNHTPGADGLNQPFYNIVEPSNDLNACSSVHASEPHMRGSSSPDNSIDNVNTGYEDEVYDIVGNVITPGRGIYQALDFNGQEPRDRTYQSLDISTKVM